MAYNRLGTTIIKQRQMDDVWGMILDELNFTELRAIRSVNKLFWKKYSDRCNWFIRTRIQPNEICQVNADRYYSINLHGVLFFFEDYSPTFRVVGLKLWKPGFYVELENMDNTGTRFHRKLTFSKNTGVLQVKNVHRHKLISFM